jgi:hypothetical protein
LPFVAIGSQLVDSVALDAEPSVMFKPFSLVAFTQARDMLRSTETAQFVSIWLGVMSLSDGTLMKT